MISGRHATVVTLLPAALLLSACGPRDQEELQPERYVDPPAVSEAADAAYGEQAKEVYEQVADFLLEHSTDEELVHPAHGIPTEAELVDDVVPRMTPEAAAAWRDLVVADLAGDADARDAVRLLRFHTWESDVSAPRVGDIVRSQWVTDGTVDVVNGPEGATATADPSSTTGDPVRPELEVSLTHGALLRLVAEDVPIDVELERPLTLTLVPDGQEWLIASFEGTLEVFSDLPVEQPGEPDDTSTTSSSGR